MCLGRNHGEHINWKAASNHVSDTFDTKRQADRYVGTSCAFWPFKLMWWRAQEKG